MTRVLRTSTTISQKLVDMVPRVQLGPSSISTPSLNQQQSSDQVESTSESKSKSQYKSSLKTYIEENYTKIGNDVPVMSSPPNDTEKYAYVSADRWTLQATGLISFLSLSAGMWLFVLAAPIFYWFGVVVAFVQIYLIISYLIGLLGKNFDLEEHKKFLAGQCITPLDAPTVDIFLPCCKEPLEILENTYKYVKSLKHPEEKLRVYVLDDGGMDSVYQLSKKYAFHYISRDDKPRLQKAGNLRWAFTRTNGEYIVIFDADFCPRDDFLSEMLPYVIADSKLAIVQSPQFFRTTNEQTWVEQGAGAVQELFYRYVQYNRNRWGASICVGSNAIYRREALAEVGGTAEIGYSEDVHTGFYCVDRGWKLSYLPINLALGICPETLKAFFSQQTRWCMGSSTLLTNLDFWRSNLSFMQRLCFLSGFLYYMASAIGIFINPLPAILLMWFRPEKIIYYNLFFAIPSIIHGAIMFRIWSKSLYSFDAQFIRAIQSYAYLSAFKDRIFRCALSWVPSGDKCAHKNAKYRNMRIFAICWTFVYESFFIAGVSYRMVTGVAWWHFLPIIIINIYNIYINHRFLLAK